jgi:ABC-type Fe3+-siderophore transport system permease subunit
MTFVSQVKLVLLLALPTGAMIFFLLLALALTGFFDDRTPTPPIIVVLTCVLICLVFTAVVAILQIAALGLLRLLPWRGPELKVEEPRNLSGIFE